MEETAAAPGSAPPVGRRPYRRGYLVPGCIALGAMALLALGINAAGLEHRTPHSLPGPDVATRIAQDMQARSGAHQPPDVRCPSTEPVGNGVRFACRLHTARADQVVVVTETSNQGTLTWALAPAGGQ